MSKLSRFDRTALGVIGGAALLVAGAWLYWMLFSVPVPAPGDAQAGLIGANGPIAVLFGAEVDRQDAEGKIAIDPPLEGKFTWSGNIASFWPAQTLAVGQSFRVTVQAGIRTTDGRSIRRAAEWQVTVRQPEVVYVSLSGETDLWRINTSGGEPVQITRTGGLVYDYGVSPDGERIAYSRFDERGGISLWIVDRDGLDDEILLDCGQDVCVNPAFSPDGTQLAYSRRLAGVTEGSAPGVPRLWTMDLVTRQTSRLYTDPNVGGSDPVWSPDGRYLAFLDGINTGLRVADLETHQDILLPTQMGMTASWARDSQSLLFTNMIMAETYAAEQVYRYSLMTRRAEQAFTPQPLGGPGEALRLDYGPPVYSSDGQWLATGIREVSGSPARQLWIMRPDGSERQQITQDETVNAGAFKWAPGVDQVLFQSLQLGSSSAAPAVSLWNMATGEIRVLVEKAGQGGWIP